MHRRIYYILIIALAVSLPVSIFGTTLAEILLLVNWIWERDFKAKRENILKNKGAILLCGIYIVHLLWLFNTSDFGWAFHDLKIKLPVLILPLIIASSSPFNEKEIKCILLFFSGSVFASSIISGAIFFGLTNIQVLDYREISIFISHIRMALMVVLSIFILSRYAAEKTISRAARPVFVLLSLWFIIYLLMLKSLTGLIMVLVLALINGFILAGRITDVAPRFIIRVMLITIPLLVLSWLSHTTDNFFKKTAINFESLDKVTAAGNKYFHDTSSTQTENGNYVYLYIADDELKAEWNLRSQLDYDGNDRKDQQLKYTLFRYMTSKGLRKDARGMKKMTEVDVAAVEDGIANHIYLKKFSIKARVYEVLWEIDSYRNNHDPGGHSVSQRLIYLKAARDIFLENPVFGTGTGDIKKEFNAWYAKTGAIENERWWNRTHNQYLTFLATFGITGFLIVMIFLLYAPFKLHKWNDYFFRCFAVIGLLSMLSEDTLETQTGVSFFMFFYSLFLFGTTREKNNEAVN
jgi:hypothetical protein